MSRLLLSVFILLALETYSQNQGFEVKLINPKTGVPSLIQLNTSTGNGPSLESPATWFKKNLNANEHFDLKFNRATTDQFGWKHYRYDQYYKGIQIDGAEVILHTKNNKVSSINGRFFPNFNADITFTLSPETALNLAMNHYTGSTFIWESKKEEQQLKLLSNDLKATYKPSPKLLLYSSNDSGLNQHYKMAYEMDIYILSPERSRPKVYIDANNGWMIDAYEQICSFDKVGTAHTKYSGIRKIHTDSIGIDSFILRDNTRGQGIYTIDARVVSVTDSTRDFIDSDNIWDNVNDFKDEVATDVHWGTEVTYDFYFSMFNRNSFDDSGSMILSRVHVGENYNNAFWDGYATNYGDGDAIKYKPFTSLDVCAHELTHGVTQHTARLRYRDESGALNESFSDLFAKAVEQEVDTAGFNWYMGEKFAIPGVGKPLRNMSDPWEFNDPKYYNGDNYYVGGLDNGGVHTNSGVQNFWFYLLCEGGMGLREDGKPYFVKAIGYEKAITVAYSNLSSYLTRNSEYIDACYLSLEAAAAIFGDNSFEFNQIKNAWYAVGLIDEVGISQETASQTQWTIMPNPGNESFVLYNTQMEGEQTLELYDYSGKLVMSKVFVVGERIDASELSNGLYFVRVGDYCGKWIKQ